MRKVEVFVRRVDTSLLSQAPALFRYAPMRRFHRFFMCESEGRGVVFDKRDVDDENGRNTENVSAFLRQELCKEKGICKKRNSHKRSWSRNIGKLMNNLFEFGNHKPLLSTSRSVSRILLA